MACFRPAPTSRRQFLSAAAVMSTALVAAAPAAVAQTQPLRPTPSCADEPQPTARPTEGPYFKPDSPLRSPLLEPGIGGAKIAVTGMVPGTSCPPAPRACPAPWHAQN